MNIQPESPDPNCRRARRPRSGEDAADLAHGISLKSSSGRTYRRRVPIAAYVGSNGSGKTLCMVHDTLPSIVQGRKIYTTVPLHYPDGSIPENVEILHEWKQILHAQHADILLDEVSAIVSARDSESLPPQMATLLQQLRKRDLVLRWTAPSWMRADKILRETTKLMTICTGYISTRMPDSMWRSNVLFHWKSFDASDYSDFASTDSSRRRLKCLQASWYVRTHGCAAQCYDTLAEVSTLGTVLMSGRCAVCGGRRRVPECTCNDYVVRTRRRGDTI